MKRRWHLASVVIATLTSVVSYFWLSQPLWQRIHAGAVSLDRYDAARGEWSLLCGSPDRD